MADDPSNNDRAASEQEEEVDTGERPDSPLSPRTPGGNKQNRPKTSLPNKDPQNPENEKSSEILEAVRAQQNRLKQLEEDIKKQKETEQNLRRETRKRRELEEKLRKIEANLKDRTERGTTTEGNHDPFTQEIMKEKVPRNFKATRYGSLRRHHRSKSPPQQLQKQNVPSRRLRRDSVQSLPHHSHQVSHEVVRQPATKINHQLRRPNQKIPNKVLHSKGQDKTCPQSTRDQTR